MSSGAEIEALIVAKGDEIRALKAAGTKDKAALKPHIDELLALKARFKEATGSDYAPPGGAASSGGKKKKKKSKGGAGAAAPAPAPAAAAPAAGAAGAAGSAAELSTAAAAQLVRLRGLQAGGAAPAALTAEVARLVELQTAYKAATGQSWDQTAEGQAAASAEAPAISGGAAAPAPAAAPANGGKSKKQLNKEAKKAKRAAARAGGAPPAAAPTGGARAPQGGPITVTFAAKGGTGPPRLSMAAAALSGAGGRVRFVEGGRAALPTAELPDGRTLQGDHAIARLVARRFAPALLGGADELDAAEVDQWLDVALTSGGVATKVAVPANAFLETRTFLVGYELTLADAALWACFAGVDFTPTNQTPHLARWHRMVSGRLTELPAATAPTAGAAAAPAAGEKAKKKKGPKPAKKSAEESKASGGDGTFLELPGAVDGQVCTRFPPEPSGYMHVGHCKAALLNDYYARHYNGRLLLRFDDTNPTKEKEEFEDAIKADMASLGIVPDAVSHTSDHFAAIIEHAERLIQAGKAYMDDTPVEQMREERMARVDSRHRGMGAEEALRLFRAMVQGDAEATPYCLRAKIDMQSVNGCMRDPVLFRANDTPHVRTGTTYKAYPTYDLACPIVDSVEGVTHALRTTEYNDRDEQYQWLQEAMGLRRVTIQFTTMSKRKLQWFVDNGHVEGWDDPRFPTVRACLRRGVSVDALRRFILADGASRTVTMMEWNKFWAQNKAVYEPTAHRYFGISQDGAVPLEISNGPEGVAGITAPLVPKDPAAGTKVLRLAKTLLIERADAAEMEEGKSTTLLRWGNVMVDRVERDADGNVTRVVATHNPDDQNFKKTKKIGWLASVPGDEFLVRTVEFDHYLLTKPKLEENERVEDFVNTNTRAEATFIADPNMRALRKGQVVQLERRGFYIVDQPYVNAERPLTLFLIPDGKTRAMSTLSGALAHR